MTADDVFRANVGIIIVNSKGEVLAFERSDKAGQWQLPQGGIHKDETPLQALKRELFEETTINLDNDLIFIDEYPLWLAYEFPEEIRKKFHFLYRGQTQKWYLFKVKDDNLKLNLKKADSCEFSNYRWMDFKALTDQMIDFKQYIYTTLMNWVKMHFEN